MKITRSWCSVTGQEKIQLEINTEGASLAEAMTRALRMVQTTAECDGGAAWEAYRSWRGEEVDKLRAELIACKRDLSKMTEDLAATRNERFRQLNAAKLPELRELVAEINAIGPGLAILDVEVHTHAGPGICLVFGAEGEPTRVLLPESLTDHQTQAASEEIRRIVEKGGWMSPAEFFLQVAGAAEIRVDADASQFFMGKAGR